MKYVCEHYLRDSQQGAIEEYGFEHKPGPDCKIVAVELVTSRQLAAAAGSASERSADEWMRAGIKAMNLAMDATEKGHSGTAEGQRKTAQMCFDCEAKLRQMQNGQADRRAEKGQES